MAEMRTRLQRIVLLLSVVVWQLCADGLEGQAFEATNGIGMMNRIVVLNWKRVALTPGKSGCGGEEARRLYNLKR